MAFPLAFMIIQLFSCMRVIAGVQADGLNFVVGVPCVLTSRNQRLLPICVGMHGHVERNRRTLLQHFDQQLILAPLTRGGNLPFRRLCAVPTCCFVCFSIDVLNIMHASQAPWRAAAPVSARRAKRAALFYSVCR